MEQAMRNEACKVVDWLDTSISYRLYTKFILIFIFEIVWSCSRINPGSSENFKKI